MSVKLKILLACLGFVAIIATMGGLAQVQVTQLGRLAVGIYDNALMGMSYVDQAEASFLRWSVGRDPDKPVGQDPGLRVVLDRLDVALERSANDRIRQNGQQTRALLEALKVADPAELPKRLAEADKSLGRLVKAFAADGLTRRDDAEATAAESRQRVLIEVAVAIVLALGVGILLGQNLSRPLHALVRVIQLLASGDLASPIPPALATRRDEIGEVARAAAVFREAMRENANQAEERALERDRLEEEKNRALRGAADEVERATTSVAAQTVEDSKILAGRAGDLAAAAARMVERVEAVTRSSESALASCEIVAAAGEELSTSAREIGTQTSRSAAEVTQTARAGDRVRAVIDQLSASVGEIDSVARLIGEIAGRTNLLALNATIEAARAGEAGRGFAVVAGEVKSLAAQTARSTGDIARSIGSIQTVTRDVADAVAEMLRGVAAMEDISRTIAASVEEQVAATARIASNVADTAGAMRSVSVQMEMANSEARDTDASVRELKTVAGNVAGQIVDLRSVMVRIVRTSSDAANRRSTVRHEVHAPASLTVGDRKLAVECLNLSAGGARLLVEEGLEIGTIATLRIGGLPELPGTVLGDGQEISFRFDWTPADAPAWLRQHLEKLAA